MDEMEIVRKITHLFYMFRKENLFLKDRRDEMKYRDIMVLDAVMKLNDGNLVKMNDLSEYFNVTPAAVSQLIKQFEKKGWIERVELSNDRRSVYLKVTDEASEMIKKSESCMKRHLVEFIEELGEQDAAAFVRILEKAFAYTQRQKEQFREGD